MILFPNESAISNGNKMELNGNIEWIKPTIKPTTEKSFLPFWGKRALPYDMEKIKNAVFGNWFLGRKQRKFNVCKYFQFPNPWFLGVGFYLKIIFGSIFGNLNLENFIRRME